MAEPRMGAQAPSSVTRSEELLNALSTQLSDLTVVRERLSFKLETLLGPQPKPAADPRIQPGNPLPATKEPPTFERIQHVLRNTRDTISELEYLASIVESI